MVLNFKNVSEKRNGLELYHLQTTITLLGKDRHFSPSGSRGGPELVNQTNSRKHFGRYGKNGKKVIPRKVLERYYFFSDNFQWDDPYHLNSPQDYRVYHTNGKRS